MNYKIFQCLHCSKEYKRYLKGLEKGTSFCSRQCGYDYRNIKKSCINCSKEFIVYRSEIMKADVKYCSRQCGKDHRNFQVECLVCGIKFHAYLCNIERGNSRFCSQSCGAKYNSKYGLIGFKKGVGIFKNHALTAQERFFKNISNESHDRGCWIWTGLKNRQGYGKLTIDYKTVITHRYSWILHNGDIPERILICHKCDTPSCVNPDHLFLGAYSDNMKDMVKKGRNRDDRGSKHPMAKLTEEQVLMIRKRLENGDKGCDLASEYNVHNMTISQIKLRKKWKHI